MQKNDSLDQKNVNRLNTKSSRIGIAISSGLLAVMVLFQNCSQGGKIAVSDTGQNETTSITVDPPITRDQPPSIVPPDLSVCMGVSCSLEPITQKVAVTTILLALGDEANDQLVIGGGSAQLIAESVIRYTTPVHSPKILVVHDRGSGGESAQDTRYVMEVLLERYRPQFLDEPVGGITEKDLEGYDLVWFNNPGNPMTLQSSFDVLVKFKGGVVLQGDDLSWGRNFAMDSLTRVKNIDNGTSVLCQDGKSYNHDNNSGLQFRITLDAEKMPTPNSSSLTFNYGNDIDLVSVLSPDVEVLAYAKGGPENCGDDRPALFRYFKE